MFTTPMKHSITLAAPRLLMQGCFCYLLHFHEPYKHARHYLGSTCNLDGRLLLHQHCNGARLTQVVREAGITWEVSRLWYCETPEEVRALERKLKRTHGHGPALCPICQGKPKDVYTNLRLGHWPLALHSRVGRRKPSPVWQNVPPNAMSDKFVTPGIDDIIVKRHVP